MNTKTFTYLQSNPQEISAEQRGELTMVLEKYPYFQSARALQLKSYKNDRSFLYNDALKLTAAYTTDRNILFEYITSDYFVQNEISELIQKHDVEVTGLPVISEDISKKMSAEIDRQIKQELKKAEAILNPELFQRKVDVLEKITSAELEEETTHDIETKAIEIDAPIPFQKEDVHSFSEWLKLTSAKPIVREKSDSEETELEEKERKFDLIDKFIQKKPNLIQPKNPSEKTKKSKNENLAAPYIKPNDSLMTETLAKVYLQQKNYRKAIQAYNILILKNPEKSGFFADQIRAIKKLTNTENT